MHGVFLLSKYVGVPIYCYLFRDHIEPISRLVEYAIAGCLWMIDRSMERNTSFPLTHETNDLGVKIGGGGSISLGCGAS